jgi:hypothetical protein
MDQTSLQRKDGGLCAIPRAHFLEHSADMDPHGLFRDMQLFSDLPIGAALRNAR